jgi:carboxyl-terminal processing protease
MFWEGNDSAARQRPNTPSSSFMGTYVLVLLVALAITAVSAFVAGYLVGRPNQIDPRFGVLQEAWGLVNKEFYYPLPTDNKEVYGAVKGMLAALGDQHTILLEPAPASRETAIIEGKNGGIGVILATSESGQLVVDYPLRGFPAQRAGIRAGDQIIAVDGQSVADLGSDKAAELIRGDLGQPVSLTIVRAGLSQPLELVVVRGQINIYGDLIPDTDIGYVSMSVFNRTATEDIKKALADVLAYQPRAVILDLRGNGGGLLRQAIDIADLFLPEGLIVTQKHSDGKVERFEGKTGELGESVPLIVLIDGGSASASEIVAGALQDRKRAVVIGQNSYGKGSVQGVYTLSDGSQLRVTRSAWYTPNETRLEQRADGKSGLTPDLPVFIPENADPSIDLSLEAAIEYAYRQFGSF